ncbi:hypothetical protein AVEN_227554-1 [Araneus ventricosus]|uniref:Uncharacterized protein n=1 Tax=Araneus ventricosus TaxID=182803 RepID=A0A4Y2C4P1_ARAVE|nr:hypothetical protein AVEN_227554-1 [Araneus ventricosus]
MCIAVPSIGFETLPKGSKRQEKTWVWKPIGNASRTPPHLATRRVAQPVEWVWTPDNHHNGRQSLLAAMCQTPEDTNNATAGVAALCCCRKTHIPSNYVAQTA